METQKKILACPGCGVSFCVKCYRLFHKESDIVGMSTGNIRYILDPMIDHIPYEAGGRARCRLYWWNGVETQKKF